MRTLPVFHENKWAQWLGSALVVAFLIFPDLLIAQAPMGGGSAIIDPVQTAAATRVGEFTLESIRYEIGPPVEEGVHAYLSFDVEGGETVQFLNARLVGKGASEGLWVLRNVPLLPHARKQRISCTVNMEAIGGVGSAYSLSYHVGEEPVTGPAFPPAGGLVGLTPQTAVHRVFSGSDDPPVAIELPAPGASTLLIFPRLPKIEYVYRGCDVPNIDLNLKECDEEETGIPCDTLACGPASAANSLQWLKKQHVELAGDTTSLRYKTDRLKQLMKLNKHGVKGVRFDSMVIGKLTLIDELKLPIHVKYNTLHESGNEKELVSDNPDYDHKADNEGKMGVHPMFDWLKKEMEAGEDVEVQLGWYGPLVEGEDGKMKRKRHYGHWLVASGYFQMGDMKGMFLKDDDDQLDKGGLRHKYYHWDTLPGGVPYIEALTDARGNVAIVESFVSESYDPTVEFNDPVSVRPDPWDELDLFHENMKPGYPFAGVKDRRGFPWWPVIVGVTGGGALVWWLTQDKEMDDPVDCSTIQVTGEVVTSTCGRANGAIRPMITGPGDLDWEWSNGVTSLENEGLPPGVYSLEMSWMEGQCRQTEVWTVTDQEIDLTVSGDVTPTDCGQEDGRIELRVEPGTEGPYNYTWSHGGEGEMVQDLAPGVYSVTVSLGSTCEGEADFEVGTIGLQIDIWLTSEPGNCIEGGRIDMTLSNLRNNDSLVVIMEGPGTGFNRTLAPGTYRIEDWVPVPAGTYSFYVYDPVLGEACHLRDTVIVEDTTQMLRAINDSLFTGFETAVTGDMLANDEGFELRVTSVDSVHGGTVAYSEEGGFTFTPEEEFTGVASFRYNVHDGCDSTGQAWVFIEVAQKGCDFQVNFEVVDASCGWNDGSIRVSVIEPGQYSYAWEGGTTGQLLEGVQRGDYTVNITDLDLGCTLTFTGMVGEQPARYFQRLQVVQPECPNSGDIRFEVITPGSGPMLMEVIHPAGSELIEIPLGLTFLSDYIPIVEGEYKVILIDEGIGPACMSEFTASIQAMETVQIELEAVIPATGPSAMDGAILAFISDPGQAPHSIYLDGAFYGMTGSNEVFIEGVGVGEHSVYVVDANGCESNVLIVSVPFQESEWSFGVGVNNQLGRMQTVEHPVVFNGRDGYARFEIMIRKQLFQKRIFIHGGLMTDGNGLYPNINIFGEWPVHASNSFEFKCRTGIQGWYKMGGGVTHSKERFAGGLFIAPVASLNVMNSAYIELSLPLGYYLDQTERRDLTTGFTLTYRVGINPYRSH